MRMVPMRCLRMLTLQLVKVQHNGVVVHGKMQCAGGGSSPKRNLQKYFDKIFKCFLKKIAKNALFSHIYQRNLRNHALIFSRLDEKHKMLGNFEKFSKIMKTFHQQIVQNEFVQHIFQKINKPCVNLLRVWKKKTIYWKL